MTDRFRLLDPDELFALELPPVEWLVEDLMPLGAAGMLSAREKAGKGLLSIDLLACIASEEPFLGRAVTSGPVAYFAAEESLRDVRDRVGARIGKARDIPLFVAPINTLVEVGREPERLMLTDLDALQRLANTIKAEGLRLVILDTLREMHDLPENESDAMGPLLRPIRQMAHDLNTTIVFNHHQNRGGSFRGSTAIKAAVDFEWSFERTDTETDDGQPTGRLKMDGRWTPQTVRITLGDGLRWQIAADLPPSLDAGVRDHILGWLTQCQRWQSAQDVADTLDQPRYKLRTIQNALSLMVKETPCPITVQRTTGRGGPKQYHCLAPTLPGVDELSQPSGTNGRESSTALANFPSRAETLGVGTNGKVRADVDLGPARESITAGDPVRLGQDLAPVAEARGRTPDPKPGRRSQWDMDMTRMGGRP